MIGRRGFVCAAWAASWPAAAHEMQGNLATLVLRERRHVALTLQIDFVSALHRAVAPAQPMSPFVAVHATLPAAQLEPVLQVLRRRVETGTALTDEGGRALTLTHWRWPDVERCQTLLQHATMRALTGGRHDHEGLAELHAQALAARDVALLQLQLPEELTPALVVWSRPRQGWARAGGPPVRADFR